MELLGLDLVRMRLRRAIGVLGGLSAKRTKELERDFARTFEPHLDGKDEIR